VIEGTRPIGRQAHSVVDQNLRKITASTADHYRAIPLSDGYHILFTDPRTGNLCLGTDAPIGSLIRLLRKICFLPPPSASSSIPLLYAAGSDIQHGIRVVATFPAEQPVGTVASTVAESSSDFEPDTAGHQVLVFYTVPPDMFREMGRVNMVLEGPSAEGACEVAHNVPEWAEWWPESSLQSQLRALEASSIVDPLHTSAVYPLEVRGQVIATCPGLLNVAIDSGPEMVIWAFSADGWARC